MRLVAFEGVSKRFENRQVFREVSLSLQSGERIGLVGRNGSGKTTALRMILGRDTPDDGSVVVSSDVRTGYNRILGDLDPDDTVTHSVNVIGIAYAAARRKVNAFLHLLRLSEMELRQKIGTLSGGQKARVALAHCLVSGSPVVILDEPTNHLDITSAQVMERALIHFPGAVVVVSHDRFFIDKVATRLLSFDGAGGVELIEGNWSTWQAGLGKRLTIAD